MTLICIACHEEGDEGDDADAAGIFIHKHCAETDEGLIALVDALRDTDVGFRPPLSIKLKIWYNRILRCFP